MSGSKAGQWARAEAWYRLWPVLQELGIDEKCPNMSGCEAAIQFVRGLAAERDEAREEVGGLELENRELKGEVAELVKEVADLREQLEEAEAAPGPAPGQPVSILYTNWRGETGRRRILPLRLRYASTEWHPGEQWLLEATDIEKGASRSFAIKDIRAWGLPDDQGEGR